MSSRSDHAGLFKQGNSGRPQGTPNKTTRLVKEVFTTVFNELQDDPKVNLREWGKANPTEFYKLASRLIPTEIDGLNDTIKILVSSKK